MYIMLICKDICPKAWKDGAQSANGVGADGTTVVWRSDKVYVHGV